MFKYLILGVIVFVLIFSGCSQKSSDQLVGSWVINNEKTVAEIAASDSWQNLSQEEKDLLPEVISEMAGDLKISFTQDELTTYIGSKTITVTYEVIDKSEKSRILQVKIDGQIVKLTITFLENGLMNFKSDATDDMDYYIWEKEK
ncbi:MAG: hypothetical protein JW996_02965 [Candidatus Cloacimonetes bacterium]|nr:hypothetical protein [Candidatus Cloacimonadota bacterium]